MNKKIIIGASLGALLALPAVAQMARQDWNSPQTRAQVQAKVQQRFAAMDANKDGSVTKAEADAYRATRMAGRDARRGERRTEMFAMLDKDRNGQLSPAEFAARPDRGERGGHAGGKRHHGPRDGMARGDGFMGMDANKDGRVTPAEAAARPLAMFDKADANKDGTVTPEERKAAFQSMRTGGQAKRG